ncbi:MAG: ACT domain-containing protein, partial [Chloroflexi bacterium]|nr:ACT domain-containing protein [Chloroflexota bacterium]
LQLKQVTSPSHELYANLITVRLGSGDRQTVVAGTVAHDGAHIVSIDGYWVDVPPSEGFLLLCENEDRPGMIGTVGTLIGELGVNISYMNVGRHEKSGVALMVLALDEHLAPDQLDRVRDVDGIQSARLAQL